MWFHWWILPVISSAMWLGMILAMFIWWEARHSPFLPSMDPGQHIAYISDVGAFQLKPLFITGGVITVVFLDAAIIVTRWLRHTGRLVSHTHTSQTIVNGFAIFFAILGGLGLILLTCFDCYHYDHVHDTMLGVFIICYVISAIFLCAESQRLGKQYRAFRSVRISFWLKLFFIIVEIALGVGFVSCGGTHHYNAAAVLEWLVALIFTFYVLSFVCDLWPAVRTNRRTPQGEAEKQLEEQAALEGRRVNSLYGAPYGIRNQWRFKKEQRAARRSEQQGEGQRRFF